MGSNPTWAWMSVCCQVEVSATSWSLVQRSPTDCGVSLCVLSRNLVNEEAMTRVGSERHSKTKYVCMHIYIYIYIYAEILKDSDHSSHCFRENCYFHFQNMELKVTDFYKTSVLEYQTTRRHISQDLIFLL
jgi:hypothetical protein